MIKDSSKIEHIASIWNAHEILTHYIFDFLMHWIKIFSQNKKI